MNYALPSRCKTLYMWIMQCYLVARHYICELCNAMLFNQSSCMWIISCYPFLYYMFICRQHLYIQLLLLCINHFKQWWKYLEWKQGLQRRQCYLLKQTSWWLQDSSPEEDSEIDDQSYFPHEVYAQTWQGYITHIMHMLSCIAEILHHIHNIEFHLLSLDIIYAIAICFVA